jgi:hypothetical protein
VPPLCMQCTDSAVTYIFNGGGNTIINTSVCYNMKFHTQVEQDSTVSAALPQLFPMYVCWFFCIHTIHFFCFLHTEDSIKLHLVDTVYSVGAILMQENRGVPTVKTLSSSSRSTFNRVFILQAY